MHVDEKVKELLKSQLMDFIEVEFVTVMVTIMLGRGSRNGQSDSILKLLAFIKGRSFIYSKQTT